jgi:osmotically-inducible protein OsmY
MKRLVSIGLGALFVAIATHGSLFAQSSYGSNSGGGGGSFGSSSSSFGSTSSAFGSTGAFGSTSSSGASGSTANANGANAGLVGMAPGGMYGGTGYGAQNGAGRAGSSYSSSSQYGNRSGGQNGQFGGGQGRQGGGSRRGGTGQYGQGQSGQGGGATANKDQQPWYEPRIEVGFSVSTPAPTVVQTNIAAPLHAPALTSRFGSVNVSVQGSTVTLRGTVPSEEDRQLAAQMAMLEPTVYSVQNDLKVAAPVAPAAMPPR